MNADYADCPVKRTDSVCDNHSFLRMTWIFFLSSEFLETTEQRPAKKKPNSRRVLSRMSVRLISIFQLRSLQELLRGFFLWSLRSECVQRCSSRLLLR